MTVVYDSWVILMIFPVFMATTPVTNSLENLVLLSKRNIKLKFSENF